MKGFACASFMGVQPLQTLKRATGTVPGMFVNAWRCRVAGVSMAWLWGVQSHQTGATAEGLSLLKDAGARELEAKVPARPAQTQDFKSRKESCTQLPAVRISLIQ